MYIDALGQNSLLNFNQDYRGEMNKCIVNSTFVYVQFKIGVSFQSNVHNKSSSNFSNF